MLKKTKKLVFALSFLSLAVCAGAGFNALNDMTASAQTANASDLYISAGASVRTDEKVEGNEVVGYDTGIRFTANASASLIESLVETTGDTVTYKTGAELGMFIVPQSYINDYSSQSTYTDYFDYFEKVKKKTKAQIAYACNAEDLDAVNGTKYRVAIMELLEKNYNRAYQSVAYYTLDGVTYYTEPSDSRTVSQVIDSALQATDVSFEDGQKSAMAGILERAIELRTHAEGTGANALHTVAVHGDKTVNLKSRFYEITAPDIAFEIVSGDDVIAIEDGVVSALKSDSTAKVKVTAYNGLVDFDVTVRTPSLGETEVIDFIGASDLEVANITNEGDVNSITYMDSFQGAQGVLKVDAKDWGHWGFDGLHGQNASIYTSAKYLVARMWVETSNSSNYTYIGESFSNADNKMLTNLKSGYWLNYYFNANKFYWNDFGSYYASMATRYAGVYYIDKIYVTDTLDVFEANTAFCIIGGNGGWDATAEVVSEYKGANDVVKITAKNWGVFTYKNLISMTECAKYDYIVMRIYADSSTTATDGWIGLYASSATRTPLIEDRWYDYYFDASTLTGLSSWESYDKAGIYFRYAGDYYIDSMYMTNELPETLTVLDFSSEASTSYLTSGGWDISSTQYLSEFENKTGVLAITGTGSYAIQCMNLGHISTEPLKGNYTHFVIRAYADTTVTSAYIRLGYEYKYNDDFIQQTVAVGEWKDYVFTMEEFDAFWANATYKGLRFGGAGTYYIDCMYFANL